MSSVTFEYVQALAGHLNLNEDTLADAIKTHLHLGVEDPLPTEPGTMFRAKRREGGGTLKHFIVTNRNSIVCFAGANLEVPDVWTPESFSRDHVVIGEVSFNEA